MKKNSEFAQQMQEKKQIEKEKLKSMGFREKVDYIWTYYKAPIIAAVLIIAFIVSTVNHALTKKESIMSSILLNANLFTTKDSEKEVDGQPEMFSDFMKSEGYDPEKFQVDTNTALVFTSSEDPASENPREYSVLCTLLMSGTVDNIFADQSMFNVLTGAGFVMPLSDYLTEDELETYKDHIIYATDEKTKKTYAAGILLDDSSKISKSSLFLTPPVFGMIYGAANQEVSGDFLRFLLE